jgi:hypothetical protein
LDRLINEKTGKMMEMKNPCIQLEDVYCRAQCTEKRLGCPRASNTYWREIWLKRIESPDAAAVDRGPGAERRHDLPGDASSTRPVLMTAGVSSD